jgi:hypothetical protein
MLMQINAYPGQYVTLAGPERSSSVPGNIETMKTNARRRHSKFLPSYTVLF